MAEHLMKPKNYDRDIKLNYINYYFPDAYCYKNLNTNYQRIEAIDRNLKEYLQEKIIIVLKEKELEGILIDIRNDKIVLFSNEEYIHILISDIQYFKTKS